MRVSVSDGLGIHGLMPVRFSWLLIFLLAFPISSNGEVQRILCKEGFGNFSSQFPAGVRVDVGPSKRNGVFASHTCDASLHWKKYDLDVVRGALQVDVDVLGADLGLGVPVVAFQSRDSGRDIGMTYQVYSLEGRPKLLKTLTGGSYYNTQDVRLEDRNEIWTDDAVAINGFENLPLAKYDDAPMVVLRFEKRRLLDVGSEYQPFFDRRIAEVRAQLDAQALDKFKRSDGKLSSTSVLSARDLRQLESTKVKVLGIVWSYLYSGREDEAWRALSEMWPPGDLERIHAALENLRTRGILREADGSVSEEHRPPWNRHAVLFDMVTVTHTMLDGKGGVIAVPDDPALVSSGHPGEETLTTVDAGPQAIYLGLPASKDGGQLIPSGKIYLNLVVDAAGKVRSAQLDNPIRGDPAEAAEVAASASWNFIPAFRSGRAVACRIRIGVSPQW